MTRDVLNNTVTLDYVYNGYGYLAQIKENDQLVWDAYSMDRYGRVNNYTLGNGINTVMSNDQNGFVNKIETKLGSAWIQNWDYDFEASHGNLTKREGLKSSGNLQEETFTYDDLNRLLTYTIGNDTYENTYDGDGKGNILTKSGIGTYHYSTKQVHRLDSISNLSENLPDMPEQDITYTKFNKIATLTHTSPSLTKVLTLTYGPDERRVKTVYTENSSTIKTKYFALGNYEKEVAADNTVRELYYFSTPTGIAAIIEKTGNQTNFYYVHTDIVGSFDVITNSSGTVQERLSFDPWGRRRNPADWTFCNVPTSFLFDRGFTGHEHLDKFDLINMNGRVYDPLLAMFLSPDNYVQNPDFTQNFGRYSYCLNNPLKYTDPTGYKTKWWHWLLGAALIDPILSTTTALITGGTVAASSSLTAGSIYASAVVTAATAQATVLPLDYTAIWFKGFDDPGVAGKQFDNAIKIDAGLFLHIPGWETEQTIVGNAISHFRNLTGKVDNVEINNWTVLVNDVTNDPTNIGGMTLGPYINSNNFTIKLDTYAHELGHTIQSRILGPFYDMKVAIPSGISAYYTYNYLGDFSYGNYHDRTWYEVWASRLGGAPNHVKSYRRNNFWYWWRIITLPSFPN